MLNKRVRLTSTEAQGFIPTQIRILQFLYRSFREKTAVNSSILLQKGKQN